LKHCCPDLTVNLNKADNETCPAEKSSEITAQERCNNHMKMIREKEELKDNLVLQLSQDLLPWMQQ